MQHARLLAALIVGLCVSTAVQARDTHHRFPIEEALASAGAKEKLDPEIRLFFGKQKHPKVVKKMGEWGTNKKTNAFGKEDKVACEWAFLSAAMELQERARKEGGNAVIEIKSNYRNDEMLSDTEYECGAGAIMAGVALKGTVVTLGK